MIQARCGPAQRPQMSSQQTAEEEEHIRTMARLTYLEEEETGGKNEDKNVGGIKEDFPIQ